MKSLPKLILGLLSGLVLLQCGCQNSKVVPADKNSLKQRITNPATDRQLRYASVEAALKLYPCDIATWLGAALVNTPDKDIADYYLAQIQQLNSQATVVYLCEYAARSNLAHTETVTICQNITGEGFPDYLLEILNSDSFNTPDGIFQHLRLWQYLCSHTKTAEIASWLSSAKPANDIIECLKYYQSNYSYIPTSTGELMQSYILLPTIKSNASGIAAKVTALAKDNYRFTISDYGFLKGMSIDTLSVTRESLINTISGFISDSIHISRPAAYINAANDKDDSFDSQTSELSTADLLRIKMLCETIFTDGSDFENILATKYHKSETGGLCRVQDGRLAFIEYLPAANSGEHKYIESKQCITDAIQTVARWHIHDQRPTGRNLAGPGLDDMEYARTICGNIVIITIISETADRELTVNFDLLTPAGNIIDLGTVSLYLTGRT